MTLELERLRGLERRVCALANYWEDNPDSYDAGYVNELWKAIGGE